MPKILPALGAAAIIAFSIGFNTVQYPIVWEMVGPSAHLPDDSCIVQSAAGAEQAVNAEPAAAAQSTKPAEPIANIPSDKSALTSSSINNLNEKSKGNEKSAGGKIVQSAVQSFPVSVAPADSSPPLTNLVPVPGVICIGNGRESAEHYPAVRRLPPVYQSAPMPAGRYAAEYPQSPIPIYPSTGM